MRSLLFAAAAFAAPWAMQSCENASAAPVPAEKPVPAVATIGGTPVPAHLDCEEDEAIWWTGVDTLDCVHIDEIVESELD